METSKTSFLSFPPELRLKVYRNLFVVDKAWADRRFLQTALSSQLLRTCNLILLEGRPVLYGENTMAFSRAADLKHWLDRWSDDVKSSIRLIIIGSRSWYYGLRGCSSLIKHLSAMTSIRRIDFDVGQIFHTLDTRLYKDPFVDTRAHLEARMPCTTFLRQMFIKHPSIGSGLIVGYDTPSDPYNVRIDCSPIAELLTDLLYQVRAIWKICHVRYKFVPDGEVKRMQRFFLALDETFPAENSHKLLIVRVEV